MIALDHEGLADDFFAGEELAVGFGSEDDDAGSFGFILFAHKATLFDGEGTESLVLRPYAANGTACSIPRADFGYGAA